MPAHTLLIGIIALERNTYDEVNEVILNRANNTTCLELMLFLGVIRGYTEDMLDNFSTSVLASLFELNEQTRLKRHESSTLEYKEAFSLASLSDYARDFAAFANNKGGYMLFGIKRAPHELLGLKNDHFQRLDPAKITEQLNSLFSQTIVIEKYEHEINGQQFGILYIHESQDKPVIAAKNEQAIKAADIFYRYGGRTERIKYAELKQILDVRSQRERDAWMRIFKDTAKIGAKNTAILDTLQGVIHGENDKVVVLDDSLIDQLKYIREGSFDETTGDPTLKLVGKLIPATVIKRGVKTVPIDEYVFTPTKVSEQVEQGIGRTFRKQPEHLWAWNYYRVRPSYNSKNPEQTDRKYCEYKTAINQYLYNQRWIDFLISELLDEKNYKDFFDAKGVRPN